MNKEYFVMCGKDFSAPQLKENKKKNEIYDSCKQFETIDKAVEFALQNLHTQPIMFQAVMKYEDTERIRNKENPYIIASYYSSKYSSYCMGESDPAPCYEISRCGYNQLEEKLREAAEDRPNKILFGIELKLLP